MNNYCNLNINIEVTDFFEATSELISRWNYLPIIGVCVFAQAAQELFCAIFTRNQLIIQADGTNVRTISAWKWSLKPHMELAVIQGLAFCLTANICKTPIKQIIPWIATATAISTVLSLLIFSMGEKTRNEYIMDDPNVRSVINTSTSAFNSYYCLSTALIILNTVVFIGTFSYKAYKGRAIPL